MYEAIFPIAWGVIIVMADAKEANKKAAESSGFEKTNKG
jgi:hypothetical protein